MICRGKQGSNCESLPYFDNSFVPEQLFRSILLKRKRMRNLGSRSHLQASEKRWPKLSGEDENIMKSFFFDNPQVLSQCCTAHWPCTPFHCCRAAAKWSWSMVTSVWQATTALGPQLACMCLMTPNKPRETLTTSFYRKLCVFDIKSARVSMENPGFWRFLTF